MLRMKCFRMLRIIMMSCFYISVSVFERKKTRKMLTTSFSFSFLSYTLLLYFCMKLDVLLWCRPKKCRQIIDVWIHKKKFSSNRCVIKLILQSKSLTVTQSSWWSYWSPVLEVSSYSSHSWHCATGKSLLTFVQGVENSCPPLSMSKSTLIEFRHFFQHL